MPTKKTGDTDVANTKMVPLTLAMAIEQDVAMTVLQQRGISKDVIAEMVELVGGSFRLPADGTVNEKDVVFLDLKAKREKLRTLRVSIEKVCKQERDEVNKISKYWMDTEKMLKEPLVKLEEALDESLNGVKEYWRRVEEERLAKERAEAAAREAEIHNLAVSRTQTAAKFGGYIDYVEARAISEEEWLSRLAEMTAKFEAEQKEKAEMAEKLRRLEELERKQKEAEEAEKSKMLERLRADAPDLEPEPPKNYSLDSGEESVGYASAKDIGSDGRTPVKRYRKKPVVVSAYQTFVQEEIDTLEGVMIASPGDFVITGIKGEIYPCKPDIFMATYEEVE
jgi:hypothetical protein